MKSFRKIMICVVSICMLSACSAPAKSVSISDAYKYLSAEQFKEAIDAFSGVIAEINEELLDAPELINENANDAWFIKVENVTEKAEELMSPEDYEAFCAEEE